MRNSYKIVGNVVLIKISPPTSEYEMHALVSLEDLPKLLALDCSWGERRTEYTSYATGYVAGTGRNSNKIQMHRYLTDCPEGLVVDHINGNGLDNRRENLRVCSHLDNMQNITKPGSGKYSKERGVSFSKAHSRWTGTFYHRKKRVNVGYFNTEEEAITAIREARRKHKEEISNG